MGAGADAGITQVSNTDFLRNTWSFINRLGDEIAARCIRNQQKGFVDLSIAGLAAGQARQVVANLDAAIFAGVAPSNIQLTGKGPYSSWCCAAVENDAFAANQVQITVNNNNSAAIPAGITMRIYWHATK